ncbi:MAG: protein translocase subunit SecF [Ilumatobacteraceae bacterium]
MSGRFSRLYRGETTINFYGRRWVGFTLSIVIMLLTVVSLFTRGLNLGMDFEGGVAWEVSAVSLSVDDVKNILEANQIDTNEAKIQVLNGSEGERIRVQVGAQTEATSAQVQQALADQAEVGINDVSVAVVSSSWGASITEKAIRALLVFFLVVSLYISWRFEWKMAVSAIAAMAHDVIISVGVYSLFGFSVTPATVVAILTILGFSLYDTIVVFDKVHDNTKRFATSRVSYGDITNISMNQVLMRSINTSIAAVLPVLSLLVIGSWVLGAIALEEFALALLVGMALGTYSSIFVATPLLAILKTRELKFKPLAGELHLGEEMLRIAGSGKKQARVPTNPSQEAQEKHVLIGASREQQSATAALSHPPRPRKNKRR